MKNRARENDPGKKASQAGKPSEGGLHCEGIILPKLKRICRSKLIQVKVAPELKRKAEERAHSLDMDLSEYVRFLLTRDIHGFS